MKKFYLSLLLLAFLINFSNGQYWAFAKYDEGISPDLMPHLSTIHFLNPNLGWVAGRMGKIYKTQNGGDDWIDQSLATSTEILKIQFFDENKGIISTEIGTMTTADGGDHWTLIDDTPGSAVFAFYDEMIGWMAHNRKIYKTQNGGVTWELNDYTGIQHVIFRSVNPYSEQKCFIGGAVGHLFTTEDGGENWAHTRPIHRDIVSIEFINDSIGFFKGYNFMVRSDDFGETFSGWIGTPIGKMDMINENEGWIVNSTSAIHHTSNGAQNWELQYYNDFIRLLDLAFLDESNGWAVGEKDLVLRTKNGGQSWEVNRSVAPNLKDLYYVDTQNIWAVGENGKMFLKTWDHSAWQLIDLPTDADLNAVHFMNRDTGWVIGDSSILLHTKNKGATWEVIELPVQNVSLKAISFSDADNGLIIGEDGHAFRTDNSGISWSVVNMPTDNNLNALSILGNQVIWAAGDMGALLKSTDNGVNWQQESWVNSEDLSSIKFSTPDQGWITSENGIVYNTIDGGAIWTAFSIEEGTALTDVFFISNEKGWVVGDKGLIYRTDDGGEHWENDVFNVETTLHAVSFIDENVGWIVGENGTILKHLGDITGTENPIQPEPITVYPNPAKDLLKIESSDGPAIDQIQLFDLTGHLVKEVYDLNSSSAQINVATFESGVYILIVKIENKIYQKKILKN